MVVVRLRVSHRLASPSSLSSSFSSVRLLPLRCFSTTPSQSVCSFYQSLTSRWGSLTPSDVVISRGYLLPHAGKAVLVDSVVPPKQVQTFFAQFGVSWEDIQYIVITGSDLESDAVALLAHCPNASILAPLPSSPSTSSSSSVSSSLSTSEDTNNSEIHYVKEGDSVVIGNERTLSVVSTLPSHLALHDSLHKNVFAGTSFALSISSAFASVPSLLLPPCVTTESDNWPHTYLEHVDNIARSGCTRVYIHGGGPVEDVAFAVENLKAGVAALIDILQSAAWRAREGKSEAEIMNWVKKELTEHFIQKGRDASLTNEQMTKAGALADWLCHAPVLVKRAQAMASKAYPVAPAARHRTLTQPENTTPKHTAAFSSRSASPPNKTWLRWELFARSLGMPFILIQSLPSLFGGVAAASVVSVGMNWYMSNKTEP